MPAACSGGSCLNSLYVDGSSYSDQLKISRWFSSGLFVSGFEDAPDEDGPVLGPVLTGLEQAAAAAPRMARPPSPSASLRLMRRPAARCTSRCR